MAGGGCHPGAPGFSSKSEAADSDKNGTSSLPSQKEEKPEKEGHSDFWTEDTK